VQKSQPNIANTGSNRTLGKATRAGSGSVIETGAIGLDKLDPGARNGA
jgi:hypothetical protein